MCRLFFFNFPHKFSLDLSSMTAMDEICSRNLKFSDRNLDNQNDLEASNLEDN